MIDAVKSRIIFILSMIPLFEAMHIAGMNVYLDRKVRNIFTLSDYITISLHRLGSVVGLLIAILCLSAAFAPLSANYFNTNSSRRKRSVVPLIPSLLTVSVFTVLAYLLRSTAPFDYIYNLTADRISGFQYFIPLYIAICVSIYFSIRVYLVSDAELIRPSMFFDSKYDILIFVIFSPIILFDAQLPDKSKGLFMGGEVASCTSDQTQNVTNAVPLERGLLVQDQKGIALISYDCLKRVDYH